MVRAVKGTPFAFFLSFPSFLSSSFSPPLLLLLPLLLPLLRLSTVPLCFDLQRRQKEVQTENHFYVQLLEQALPEDCRASKNERGNNFGASFYCNIFSAPLFPLFMLSARSPSPESDSYSKAVPEESGEVSSGKKRHVASNGKLPASSPSEDAQFCETRQLANHNGASRRDSTPSSPSSSSFAAPKSSSVTCSDHVTSGSISDDVITTGDAGSHSTNGTVSTGGSSKGSAAAASTATTAAVAAKNGLSGGGKRVHNNTGGVPGKENNLHTTTGKSSGVSSGKGKASNQSAPLNNCVVLKKDDQNSR